MPCCPTYNINHNVHSNDVNSKLYGCNVVDLKENYCLITKRYMYKCYEKKSIASPKKIKALEDSGHDHGVEVEEEVTVYPYGVG